jgi:hypothetical protein
MRRKLASLAAAAAMVGASLFAPPAAQAYTTYEGVYAILDYASPYALGVSQSYINTTVVLAQGHWNWEYQGDSIDPTINYIWLGPRSCVAVWHMVGGAWIKYGNAENWHDTGRWVSASAAGLRGRGLNRLYSKPMKSYNDLCYYVR